MSPSKSRAPTNAWKFFRALLMHLFLPAATLAAVAAQAGSIVEEQLATVEPVRVKIASTRMPHPGVPEFDETVFQSEAQELISRALEECGLREAEESTRTLWLKLQIARKGTSGSTVAILVVLELREPVRLLREDANVTQTESQGVLATTWHASSLLLLDTDELMSQVSEAVDWLAVEFAQKTAQAQVHQGIRSGPSCLGQEVGAMAEPREPSKTVARLAGRDVIEVTAAFKEVARGGHEFVPALIAKFSDRSPFEGICGSASLESQFSEVDIDLDALPETSPTGGPREVREACLYLLLTVLGKSVYFADSCQLQADDAEDTGLLVDAVF